MEALGFLRFRLKPVAHDRASVFRIPVGGVFHPSHPGRLERRHQPRFRKIKKRPHKAARAEFPDRCHGREAVRTTTALQSHHERFRLIVGVMRDRQMQDAMPPTPPIQQRIPRLGSEPLQLPTFDERTSLIAANAAYYSAVRRKDADLMEQLLDDDCTMGNSHNYTRGKEQNARDFRNYCENPTPPKYPYLVELDDVEVFLDSENVGRVVVTERNTADWCASSDDYRPSQSPVTIAREVNVNTFARAAPGQPWKLRQRQETRVDFETNARSDQAQA